jgi:hypothetical protein
MQRKHTENSTSNIYRALKNIELCRDGIRLQNGTSIRLSNLQYFPNNLINNTSTLFKILCLLSLASLEKAEAAISYFGSPDKKQNYKVIIEGNSNINIGAGDCNTVPVDHAVPYGYQLLKNWINPDHQDQTYNVQFMQGEGEPVNNDIQNCGFDFIQQQINKIQAQVEAAKIAYRAKNEEDLKILGMVLGSVCGFILLVYLMYELINKMTKPSPIIHFPTYRSTENNKRGNSEYSEESSSVTIPPKIEDQKIEPKISMAERLENLKNIQTIIIPEDFICPVNKTIMTDPCITNDGYSYEKSALERLQKEHAKCPMNLDEYVINIISNNPLRSSIISFVENQERIDKEKTVLSEIKIVEENKNTEKVLSSSSSHSMKK